MKSIEWRLGTMGFSYGDWREVFYPSGMPAGEYLSFYAKHHNTVELDTTFHATPPPDRVKRWRDATPEDFKFVAKAPKLVTHALKLESANGPIIEFIEVIREFGAKLGVVLLQFPPSFKFDQFDRLREFLRAMPGDVRFAVELRDRSWGRNETLAMLREAKVAFCSAEYASRPTRIPATTDFTYVRWIGEHQRFPVMDHEQIDVTPALNWWAEELQRLPDDVKTIWGFFNNDYAGCALATCNRFKRVLGLPVSEPKDQRQGRLF